MLINPHTSHYFRSEAQVTSDEGLNAYGASTWGQFFIYQGFNPHAGWMHTSSGIDNVDEFAEKVERRRKGAELTRKDSEVIVETIFDSIVRSLRVGDKIEIRGFGSFRTRQRKPRVGRNPKTGERVEVPAKKIPFFKPSKELKDLVNTGGGHAPAPPAPPAPPTPAPA